MTVICPANFYLEIRRVNDEAAGTPVDFAPSGTPVEGPAPSLVQTPVYFVLLDARTTVDLAFWTPVRVHLRVVKSKEPILF